MFCHWNIRLKSASDIRQEERLPPEKRTRSRRHELNLFTNRPPCSIYLNSHHPSLYDNSEINDNYTTKVEAIRNDKCVFKLDGFRKFCIKQSATRKQIVDTSKLIRDHCQGRNITLDQFLIEFEQYAKTCKLCDTVTNVWGYLQKQLIKDEMTMISNWPVSFSFLDDDELPCESFRNTDDDKHLEALNIPVNGLKNQKKLLHSINVLPTMISEITYNPWRVDKRIC
ncbi:hypothetical protein MSG28_014039 [Choristoneura fumiferana]|uniref:Uncharacterized protein n=1 Tax=Choristoneura fumiferana TaxID=7141 RepID=A0ACC0JFM8_CHOFU|nr:hypothetical protein MSG28_014039 [Choristoneura fumiferana]